MNIEACVAHAIHNDLDIVEMVPDIHAIPLEELEPYIENFVVDLQQSLVRVVRTQGEPFLRGKDAAGLCAICIQAGIGIPTDMLLRMCNTIMRLAEVDAKFIADTPEGESLYYMKMELAH